MMDSTVGRALIRRVERAEFAAEMRAIAGGIFRLIELALLVAILVCVW